jgi:hypothetical protein
MSEKTEIPVSEPESPDDGAISRPLNEDSAPSYKYLPRKLDDAERLLAYAAKKGIDIDPKTRDAILKARTTVPNRWDKEIAANFLLALTNLGAKLKPVKTIKKYEFVVIVLAFLIIPFSLATFITSGISKALNADIQRANEFAVKLGDQYRATNELAVKLEDQFRATREPDSKAPIQTRSQIVPRDLQEFAAIMRAIDARAWQLNFFVLYSVFDPDGRTWLDIWSNKRTNVRDRFEIPPGKADDPTVATDKIAVFQDVRYFAKSVDEFVSITYGAMADCILPVLYALLGACACLLRLFEAESKLRTFSLPDFHIARLFIAAIGGAVVGLFNNFNVNMTASISPLAIAFLVGYAVDVFFSFLETLLQTFKRRGDAAPEISKTTVRESGSVNLAGSKVQNVTQ